MITKAHLLTVPFVAPNKSRPEISGILVKPNKDHKLIAVATDSYSLLEITEDVNAEDIPKDGIILKGSDLRAVKGNVTYVAFLETEAILSTKNTDYKVEIINGRYPDYHQLIPTDKPTVTLKINAKYLKKMADAFVKLAHHPEMNSVTIEIRDNNSPVIFRSEQGERKALGVIMPIKF